MKRYLIFLILITACTPEGMVWMELEPEQCGDFRDPVSIDERGTPYEFNQLEEIKEMGRMISSSTDTARSEQMAIDRYNERFGEPLDVTITIHDTKKTNIQFEVCAACTCSKGYTRKILVEEEYKDDLETIGYIP